MTKKLITLVIFLLGSIQLYIFSASAPSFTNNRTPPPMFLPEEIYTATDTSYGSQHLGDANADDKWSVSDVVYLVNYLFKVGPRPKVYPAENPNDPLTVLRHGDANDDCHITVSDVVFLINFMFKGGLGPVHNPPPLYEEKCCCVVYGNDSTKCDLTKCK